MEKRGKNDKEYQLKTKIAKRINEQIINQNKDVKELENYFQEQAEEIYKIYGPHWKTRNENCRHLISISSAALILTIAFIDPFIQSEENPARIILILSWVSFILAIIFSVITIWITMDFNSLRAEFFRQWPKIVDHVNKRKHKIEEIDFVGKIMKKVTKKIDRDKLANLLINIGYASFVLAMILLIVFGYQLL